MILYEFNPNGYHPTQTILEITDDEDLRNRFFCYPSVFHWLEFGRSTEKYPIIIQTSS